MTRCSQAPISGKNRVSHVPNIPSFFPERCSRHLRRCYAGWVRRKIIWCINPFGHHRSVSIRETKTHHSHGERWDERWGAHSCRTLFTTIPGYGNQLAQTDDCPYGRTPSGTHGYGIRQLSRDRLLGRLILLGMRTPHQQWRCQHRTRRHTA